MYVEDVQQGLKFMSRIDSTVLEVVFKNGGSMRIPLTDTQLLMFMKCLGLEIVDEKMIQFYDDASLLGIMKGEDFAAIFGSGGGGGDDNRS